MLGFAGDPKGVTGDGTSPQRQLGRGVMLSQHAMKFAGPDFLSQQNEDAFRSSFQIRVNESLEQMSFGWCSAKDDQ